MTSMPGGASDKAGNRYEALWTVLRMAGLLGGEVGRIRIEPPGDAGRGIEFEIDVAGVTWGEQAKDRVGTWTIKRLKTEGILADAKDQISRGRRFRLVASTGAVALATLTDRARATESFDEFSETLTAGLRPDFDDICRYWAVEGKEGWRLLKQIYFEQHSMETLLRITTTELKGIYAADPDRVVAELRQYCDDHVHESLTATQVAAHLSGKGFQTRLLLGDKNIARCLSKTVERQRRRVEQVEPAFGRILRPETDAVIAKLLDEHGPQLTVLDGAAGMGKSAVVTDVALRLEAQGWFVAIARMDLDAEIHTSCQLGRQMGLSESPSVLLAGVAQNSRGLLVIEQLDAASMFSGRVPDSFDAVDEILDEVSRAKNIKVLLVCRTVDLQNDPRMRRFLRDGRAVSRYTLGLLAFNDVTRYLESHNINRPPADTIQLLRTPLHLAVYGRLSEEAQGQPYHTLPDLYRQLSTEVRRRAAGRARHLDWEGMTSALVAYMNSHETLAAPATLLDNFAPEEVGALASEGLLIYDHTAVSFFHESFFDYLFARGFVHAGDSLHDFLADSGQYLFRRAQTRQVLEHLVATDRASFRESVVELLGSDRIRSHLKDVVVGVLRVLPAVEADWEAIETIAWSDTAIGRKLLALLSEPQWFDAADKLGRWANWLSLDQQVDIAFHSMVFAARKRPGRVAELLRPYVGAADAWRHRLATLVSWSLTPGLVDFAVELIECGEIDGARGPIAVNSDFWSLVYGIADDDPNGAARIIGAYLRRCLARAKAAGAQDPFGSGHLAEHSQSAGVIREVAAAVPVTFVKEVLPFVIEVAQAEQRRLGDLLPRGVCWEIRFRDTAYTVSDIVFTSLDSCLQQLCAVSSQEASTALGALRDAESDELRFLACRSLCVSNDAEAAVNWLIADVRNLALGWADSPWWASRELVGAFSSSCSAKLFAALEATLLSFDGPLRTITGWQRCQYVLLSALDRIRMSRDGLRRIAELERRFEGDPPTGPEPIEAQVVGPPVSDAASKLMSDDQWIRALAKYNGDEPDRSSRRSVGGALQLAQLLGERVVEDPVRFARLALTFGDEVPAVAMQTVIRNVIGAVESELLALLCEHAAAKFGEAVGWDVCNAARVESTSSPKLVTLVENYSRADDPNREFARPDGSGQFLYGGDLYNAGFSSTRGSAALATAAILRRGDCHLGSLLQTVVRLANDPILAVRTCAADAVIALSRCDLEASMDIAEELFNSAADVLDARSTQELLLVVMLHDPGRFGRHLDRALAGSPSVAERAGAVWAALDLRGAEFCSLVDGVGRLMPHARAGAARVFASNAGDCVEQLSILFDDQDSHVREVSARSMRRLAEIEQPQLDQLVDKFIDSAAFAENCEGLFLGLESLSSRLPRRTLAACSRAVEIAGPDLGDIRTARAALAPSIITVLLRLYRQGNNEIRSNCLNVIDELGDFGGFGMSEALAYER